MIVCDIHVVYSVVKHTCFQRKIAHLSKQVLVALVHVPSYFFVLYFQTFMYKVIKPKLFIHFHYLW